MLGRRKERNEGIKGKRGGMQKNRRERESRIGRRLKREGKVIEKIKEGNEGKRVRKIKNGCKKR